MAAGFAPCAETLKFLMLVQPERVIGRQQNCMYLAGNMRSRKTLTEWIDMLQIQCACGSGALSHYPQAVVLAFHELCLTVHMEISWSEFCFSLRLSVKQVILDHPQGVAGVDKQFGDVAFFDKRIWRLVPDIVGPETNEMFLVENRPQGTASILLQLADDTEIISVNRAIKLHLSVVNANGCPVERRSPQIS